MKKKLFTLITAIIVAVSSLTPAVMPITTMAATNVETGKCGPSATYTFDKSTGKLTISGSGEVNKGFFKNNSKVKSVVIGDKITLIHSHVLKHCDNLTTVDLGKGVKAIYYGSFYDCPKLSTIKNGDKLSDIDDLVFTKTKWSNVGSPYVTSLTYDWNTKKTTVKFLKLSNADKYEVNIVKCNDKYQDVYGTLQTKWVSGTSVAFPVYFAPYLRVSLKAFRQIGKVKILCNYAVGTYKQNVYGTYDWLRDGNSDFIGFIWESRRD